MNKYENKEEIFCYYELVNKDVIGCKSLNFATIDDVIKYISTSNDIYYHYDINVIKLYKDNNGILYQKYYQLGILPNKMNKKVSYYALGEIDNILDLTLLEYFSSSDSFDFNSISNELYNYFENKNLGIYKVTIMLNDNNQLKSNIKLVYGIGEKEKIKKNNLFCLGKI